MSAPATNAGPTECEYCFIGGQGKSGTTWLQLILDSHPEICCHGEGHPADVLAARLSQAVGEHRGFIDGNNRAFSELRPVRALTAADEREVLRTAIAALLARQCTAPLPRVLADRTPANIEFIALLNDLFPRARFVHVLRDPRDVAVSLWFHGQRTNPGWIESRYGTLDALALELAGNWSTALTAVRQSAVVLDDRYLEVRYEDLHDAFDVTVSRLFDFLGVANDPAAIGAAAAASSFDRVAAGRKPGSENRESHFRKGISGDWRNHLDPGVVAQIVSLAGPLFKELGYL